MIVPEVWTCHDLRLIMIEIQRLNMDSSWLISWAGIRIVVDPWLAGSEVDGFRWFNEQWHTTEPVPISELGRPDVVLVSQPYSDHCHSETIRQMDFGQVIAVPPARRRLQREIAGIAIKDIPEISQGWLTAGPLQVADLLPDRWIDPIYHAIAIRQGDEAILYAPHGFALSEVQLKALEGLHIRLLMTTYTWFRIPALLGGLVNPGIAAAQALAAQVHPDRIVNTHDEQKRGRGFISRVAKAVYADMAAHSKLDSRVIDLPDYRVVTL